MNISDTLLPCPFCGEHSACTRHIRDGRQAYCRSCGASACPSFHGPNNDTEQRAIAAWNARSDLSRIESRDERGNLIASTEPRQSMPTVEELNEQRIREGHIRFADQAEVETVPLFIEHLERSAGAEGVHIDAEDCADLARDLRTAIGITVDPDVIARLEWDLHNRDYFNRAVVSADDLKAVLTALQKAGSCHRSEVSLDNPLAKELRQSGGK